MSDALISPVVGAVTWAMAAGAAGWSARKLRLDPDGYKIPLTAVTGAFVFAAQMINFAIPGTGSSGHIGGGILLAALLGPYAGFVALASVLFLQAFFFADGGLLAFGCNLINMGFFTCFVAYPLIYRNIVRKGFSTVRVFTASIISVVAGLQLGALAVAVETVLSGRTSLPFSLFVAWLLPVHLAIGVFEGIVTGALLTYMWKTRPELFLRTGGGTDGGYGRRLGRLSPGMKRTISVIAIAAILTAGVLSWFASNDPDGLEWAIEQTTGGTGVIVYDGVNKFFVDLQQKIAFFPDYQARSAASNSEAIAASLKAQTGIAAGVGAAVTAVGVGIAGAVTFLAVKKRRKKKVA